MRRRLYVGVLVTLMFAGLAGNAFAQTGSAQLGGIVADSTKALVPGVTVIAKNSGTGVAQTQITNESGAYSFPVLQPGTYEVSAELPGFKKSVQRDVALPYAGQVRLNFTLEIGAVTTSVEVSVAQESVLRETSASVGDVLTMRQDRKSADGRQQCARPSEHAARHAPEPGWRAVQHDQRPGLEFDQCDARRSCRRTTPASIRSFGARGRFRRPQSFRRTWLAKSA